MNRINPEKLSGSKWTAVTVQQKQRHFIIAKLLRNADEKVVACEIEAVIDKQIYTIDWRQLKNPSVWIMGWK